MPLRLRINLPEDLREQVLALLYDGGCEGVEEFDQSLLAKDYEQLDGSMLAYFPDGADISALEATLAGIPGLTSERETYEVKDWQAAWKESFGCVRASGLLICPPWKEAKPAADETLVLLDPGNAFGAGDHVTTVMVIEAIREFAAGHGAGKRFLDLGTGTGILALAAALYGFGEIVAVDIEPPAADAARKNFALNGMEGRAKILAGTIADAGQGYDLIAANIHLDPLVSAMPEIAAALNPGGQLIASGILDPQAGELFVAAGKVGLIYAGGDAKNGWRMEVFDKFHG